MMTFSPTYLELHNDHDASYVVWFKISRIQYI